jgi:hypothetical protein
MSVSPPHTELIAAAAAASRENFSLLIKRFHAAVRARETDFTTVPGEVLSIGS